MLKHNEDVYHLYDRLNISKKARWKTKKHRQKRRKLLKIVGEIFEKFNLHRFLLPSLFLPRAQLMCRNNPCLYLKLPQLCKLPSLIISKSPSRESWRCKGWQEDSGITLCNNEFEGSFKLFKANGGGFVDRRRLLEVRFAFSSMTQRQHSRTPRLRPWLQLNLCSERDDMHRSGEV